MNKIRKLGLVGLLGVGSLFGSGCEGSGLNEYDAAAVGALGYGPVGELASGIFGIAGDHQRDMEVAREGKTEVYVGSGEVNYRQGKNKEVYELYRSAGKEIPENLKWIKREGGMDYWRPEEGYTFNDPKNIFAGVRRVEEELIVQYYKDDNGDGKPQTDEVLGNIDGPINLDEFGLTVRLKTVRSGKINYTVRDWNGNLVGSTNSYAGRQFSTNSNILSGDFMDNLNGFSRENPGEFTFYIRQDGLDEIFKKEITITRNSK